jgi:multidrug efflux pump
MTGLAFCFGVAPMVIAAGASAKSQQALGTVVMGGMIAVVVLALIMVPIFFVVVQRVFDRRAEDPKPVQAEAGAEPQLGD